MESKTLIILGIRGVPASHGGFETFAEALVVWLRDRGWRVIVYCQGSQSGKREEDSWEGIERIHIPVTMDGPMGTIQFDIRSTMDALKQPGRILTLGYNTGFLAVLLRFKKRLNLINMDGLEWKRAKYKLSEKIYLWVNERLAAWSGNTLIADHPEIGNHLASRVKREKIVMIPYGSTAITDADPASFAHLGLEAGRFMTVIARPEPENSILEIVEAFSRKPRGVKLAVLGKYRREVPYQAKVLDAASDEVVFCGAIYDKPVVNALRFHSLAYVHGHQVGGTNPSLVEALGAGNPVIAHDNPFNAWVASGAGIYFSNADQCEVQMERFLGDPVMQQEMRRSALDRWQNEFTWEKILSDYERAIAS